ncbi:MAG: enoyl-[acyl-carrier-protein] reductase FabK [Bacillota bacterium]
MKSNGSCDRMSFRTRLCDLLDIEYPVIQGGMAWLATASLAAAVSQAGGLGVVGAGNAPPDVVQKEIREVKERTTRPFGVNVMLLSPYVKEVMEIVLREKVPVVTTGAGNPGTYLPALKEAGCKVIPVVAGVSLAKRLERQGVDAVIAEGTESGGHIGETSTMALVPQVVDAVQIPVIAAGGIADGRGIVAALALGAAGVQMGTRFVVSRECPAHPNYKAMIIKAGDHDTVVTGRVTGHPVRVIKNRLAREMLRLEAEGISAEEFEKLGTGKYPLAAIHGDVEQGSVLSGQIAGMIKAEESVASIFSDLVRGVEKTLKELAQLSM